MKLSHLSSQSIASALRYSITSMQSQMLVAQKEITTGRFADVSLSLGEKNGRRISLIKDSERLGAIIDTNKLATSRIDMSNDAIMHVADIAGKLQETLTSSMSGNVDPSITVTAAKTAIADMTALLNSAHDGGYLFAGANTDVKPIADHETGPAKAAMNSAFQTYFGFAKTDPLAGTITSVQMDAFVTSQIEPMFLGAGWNANVSAASDDGIRSRIALNETAVTSVSANEQGFRKAIFAAALAAEFSESPLSAGAKTAVATRSVTLVGEAAGDFANLQGRLGFVSKQVDEASTRLNLQSEHLSGLADDMAAVDPYEASTRLTALLSQIETSYALTARIQNLSFLRFMT